LSIDETTRTSANKFSVIELLDGMEELLQGSSSPLSSLIIGKLISEDALSRRIAFLGVGKGADIFWAELLFSLQPSGLEREITGNQHS